MSSAIAAKRFNDEFALMLDRTVKVISSTGVYTGRVLAYNPADYSLWMADVKEEKGETYGRIFLSGRNILRIEVLEAGPDLSQLVERLNKLFPNLVTYHRESDTIVVMDRVRVSREGVFGEGPAAERVKRVYEEFMKEQRGKTV